jgi:hypothetical protein
MNSVERAYGLTPDWAEQWHEAQNSQDALAALSKDEQVYDCDK